MACRVTWSPQALADIEAIATYIAQDSPFYARAVVTRIVAVAKQLAQFPLSGRIVPEMRDPSIRELFVFSYRVIYRVEGEKATVVAVVHGKRLLDTDS